MQRFWYHLPDGENRQSRTLVIDVMDRGVLGSEQVQFHMDTNGREGDYVTHDVADLFDLLPRLRRFLESQGA
jgi:hypothetical protein